MQLQGAARYSPR